MSHRLLLASQNMCVSGVCFPLNSQSLRLNLYLQITSVLNYECFVLLNHLLSQKKIIHFNKFKVEFFPERRRGSEGRLFSLA